MNAESVPLDALVPDALPACAHAATGAMSWTGRVSRFLASAVRRPVIVLLSVLAAVLGAYLPSLEAGFLWDDNMLVKGNFLIRSPLFVFEAFRHTLFDGQSRFYRPTQTLTFIGDYWFWGSQPFGYHLTSILIHALAGFMLFLLLSRLLPSLLSSHPVNTAGDPVQADFPLLAWLLALVWSLYPIHSAAVAYVSGSADSLATLFCTSAWLVADRCLRAVTTRARIGWGTLAAACLLAGLCSKEIAFVWLVLFSLHTFLLARADAVSLRRKLVVAGGSLVVIGVYLLLRCLPPTPPVMPESTQKFSHTIMALRALGDYGSLLLFPGKLLMERQVYPAPNATLTFEDRLFFSSLTFGGVLVLALFLAGVIWKGSGQRLRIFGFCWFLCGYLPVSNIFVTINASVAEHWLYLPSIGFLLFVTGCAWQLPTRRMRLGVVAVGLIAASAFAVRTYVRAFDWKDELTFFRQTVLAGGDVPRARVGMANSYSHLHQDGLAILLLRQVAAEYPGNLTAQVNLASALARQGEMDEARTILEKAFLRAEKADAHTLLVIVADLNVLEGDRPGWPALRDAALAKARREHPESWELLQARVREAESAGQQAATLEELARFAQGHWWHYPSWYLLGKEYAQAGQTARAVATFKRASQLDVHDAEALAAAAEVSAGSGKLPEAVELQRGAVNRQPDSPRQRVALAKLFSANQQPDESARELAIAKAMLRDSEPPAP